MTAKIEIEARMTNLGFRRFCDMAGDGFEFKGTRGTLTVTRGDLDALNQPTDGAQPIVLLVDFPDRSTFFDFPSGLDSVTDDDLRAYTRIIA